ncbi:uncharacterized protein BXZ73DRAFT_104512 [Epithele typhae]|uniref:uncharacterized protein n=1 Tax=Epithele typhae TaxID=378194 RepID=UPI002007AC54|nr:uncharacterized protein BXZ73DRAFT_104512 [Epithele typhae]KAH9921223.1 hypothetical protein BXZ73DRAFT_104512 [Epithele typhae]
MSTSIIHRLNEDILLAILSYLPGHDAVQLARTCKFMYALSCPNCSVEISHLEQHKVSRLAEAICRPGSSCAAYLGDLGISLMSNKDEDIRALGEILRTIKSLRKLSLSAATQKGWTECPSIIHALTQMKDLRALDYYPIFLDDVLPMIQSIPSPNLVNLSLGYDVVCHHDFAPLLSALKSFPKLVILTLYNFTPELGTLDAILTSSLPSIRHIALKAVSIAATDILYLCPNLETIELSPSHERKHMQGHTDQTRPRWPTGKVSSFTVDIRHGTRFGGLVVLLHDEQLQDILVELLERRASPVPCLELGGDWEFTRDGATAVDADTSRRLARLLAALQPRALTLPVHAGYQSPDTDLDGRMWIAAARRLPRLRSLTLRSVGADDWEVLAVSPSDAELIDPISLVRVSRETLPAALARLPLHCLFIDASARPVNPSDGRRRRGSLEPYIELKRVEALDALPANLLPALTEMRVLGIKGMAAQPAEAFNDAKDSELLLRELDGWRKQHAGERNTRWWRVDGTGAERSLVEIWREYGEQAQKLVENGDADLADIYLDRCRYEP